LSLLDHTAACNVRTPTGDEKQIPESRAAVAAGIMKSSALVPGVPGAADLPAVKWRQLNLDKLSKEKRAELVKALEKVLSKK
jgi:hypothetical protein